MTSSASGQLTNIYWLLTQFTIAITVFCHYFEFYSMTLEEAILPLLQVAFFHLCIRDSLVHST